MWQRGIENPNAVETSGNCGRRREESFFLPLENHVGERLELASGMKREEGIGVSGV
jgi:hypothetical protein